MDRGWISTGRRPNGLCGSAILIAARVLNFKRSTSQIVKVAHVCEETLRKRLTEFKGLKIAQLTRNELKKIENAPLNKLKRTVSEQSVEETMDPPSFTKKRLSEELNVSEKEVDKYLKILAAKAEKISRKLQSSYQDESIVAIEQDHSVKSEAQSEVNFSSELKKTNSEKIDVQDDFSEVILGRNPSQYDIVEEIQPLNDQTEIRGIAWSQLKKITMDKEVDHEHQPWYKEYSSEDKKLLDQLIKAQTDQNDDKPLRI